MSRTYPRLSIEEFGKQLLDSGDLDPIYLGLHRLELARPQKARWLLAYWCYYSAGVASYLSDADSDIDYWSKFIVAAHNPKMDPAPIGGNDVNGGWPRGKERRHFRGLQAVKASNELLGKYPAAENAIDHLVGRPGDPVSLPFSTLRARVKEWRGFGDWISFKVGDMLDRCGVAQVAFSFDDAMYKDPTEAALMQWRLRHNAPANANVDDPKAAVREVVDYLIDHFKGYAAPPLYDRPVGYPEVETILCCWKSHVKGSYPLFNDIDEISHGLKPWVNHSATAKRLLSAMPASPKSAAST
jgi:hypothetical protein